VSSDIRPLCTPELCQQDGQDEQGHHTLQIKTCRCQRCKRLCLSSRVHNHQRQHSPIMQGFHFPSGEDQKWNRPPDNTQIVRQAYTCLAKAPRPLAQPHSASHRLREQAEHSPPSHTLVHPSIHPHALARPCTSPHPHPNPSTGFHRPRKGAPPSSLILAQVSMDKKEAIPGRWFQRATSKRAPHAACRTMSGVGRLRHKASSSTPRKLQA